MRTTLRIVLIGVACAFSGCSSSAPGAGSANTAPTVTASGGATAGPSIGPSPAATVESAGAPGPTASEVASMRPEPFVLASTSFHDGEAIPRRFTCDAENLSPDLAWSGAPAETRVLVLIVTDPDARDFIHWLVYDVTGTPSGGLPTGISASPEAPPQGTNDFGKRGYGGPCPPSGTHHYRFTLSALDTVLELTGTPRAHDLRAAMAGHVLAEATLTGTYRRS